MKRGWVFVLIVGMAFFTPCCAETDLGQLNNQMDVTSDPEPNNNDSKIWTNNSSTQFAPVLSSGASEGITLTPGVAKGITLTPGVAKGITLTPGVAKGITLTPGVAEGITLTSGIDKGIILTPGIDKGINKTVFICNII